MLTYLSESNLITWLFETVSLNNIFKKIVTDYFNKSLWSDFVDNHMARWNLFDVVDGVILKFPTDL